MTQASAFTKSGLPTGRPNQPAAPRPAQSPARRHALALAAAALLATPAAQALDIFTGNAPAYVGAWFNGVFTEVQQFQFALDWQGWCNAHAGSICSNHRYWNVAGNWNNNVVPGGASDVRITAGDTVRVGFFNSTYLGLISGTALAGTVTGTGRVELYGSMTVGNGAFADLWNDRDNQGTLVTTGLSTVNLLSSGAGRFRGQGGATVVQAFTPSPARGLFEPIIGSGHTFRFIGNSQAATTALGPAPGAVAAAALHLAPAGMSISLEPTARFVNDGVLDMGGGTIFLQGTATVITLPVFDNNGTLSGSGTVGAVRFNNAGTVNLAAGGSLGFAAIGTHSGSFSAGVGSAMGFGGLFAGTGHRFLGAVNSQGDVTLSRGSHQTSGAWNVARTFVQGGGEMTFDGPAPQVGELHVNGDGLGRGAIFNSAGGATLQSVFVDNTGVVEFNAGSSTAQHLTLRHGRLTNQGTLQVAQSFDWHSGALTGTGTLHLPGQTTLHAGTRVMNTNIELGGTLDWNAGNFSTWAGHMTVLPTGRINIAGDFSSAGGGGSIFNRGTVITKQAGTGRAELGMVVNSEGGTTRALAGTLAFTGGGLHTRSSFEAAAGARIELSGGTVFGGSVSVSGRLDVVGGSFELLQGVQFAQASGNRFDVAAVRINAGAHLSVVDALVTTGSLTNLGTFAPSSHVQIGGDFAQQGSFGLNPGKNLVVYGTFSNSEPLTVSDALLQVDTLINGATLNVIGSASFSATTLDNRGTLVLGPANGVPGISASIGGVGNSTNTGTLRVDGAAVSVSSNDLQNSGSISNEGSWRANGNFSQTGSGRFSNAGTLTIDGSAGLFNTAQINNSGSLVLQGGVLDINAGTQINGAGSFLQLAGVTRVNGRLQADGGSTIAGGVLKGAGTVEGYVTISPAGQWTPGNSPGTMTVLGDADLWGSLEVEVATPALHDRLLGLNNFTARDGAAISFIFAPGYVPQEADSDSVTWLSAAGTNFAPGVNTSFSGLPNQWSAALSPDGRQLVLNNDLAVQIPTRGSVTVAAGAVQFNALSSNSADYPLLDGLDNAGFFHNRAGASANVGGVLNNDLGATLVNRGELYANTLNNAGQLNNRSGGTLQVSALTNSGTLVTEGSVQVINDFTNAEGAVFEQRGTMQLGGLSTNRGSLLVAGPTTYGFGFNNIGNTTVEATGSIVGGPGSWFWASAGDVRVDGLLSASDIRFFGNNNNGRLSGTGRLQGNVESFADIEPGNSVGTLTVDGNLRALGDVNLEIASATDYDRLVVNGNAEISHATFYLLGDYRPVLGDSFSVLSVSGTLSGAQGWQFLRQVDPTDPGSGWTGWALPSDLHITFAEGTVSITAVPEPSTWALWLAGLVAVVRIARRRVA